MVSDFRDPEERLQRALARYRRGHRESARTELEGLLRLGYACVEVYLYLGHCALEEGRLEPALGYYRRARRRDPDHPEVCVGRGVLAARRQRYRRAVRLLRRAVTLEPGFHEAWDNLILCHGALREPEQAEEAFEASRRLDPESPHPYFNFAFVRLDHGSPKAALPLWQRVLELDPTYPDAERMAGNCERMLGDLDAAHRHLQAGVRTDPRNPDGWADLGLLNEERDEWQSAAESYERALELDPTRSHVRARVGLLLYRNGREEEGLNHLERAVASAPTAADVLDALTLVLGREGRAREAERRVRAAVRGCPDDPDLRALWGRILTELGQPLRGAAQFRRAAALDVGEPSHWCEMGEALAESGRAGAAVQTLREAVRRFPAWSQAYRSWAAVEKRRGNAERSLEILERGRTQLREDVPLALELARSNLDRGLVARALELLNDLSDRKEGRVERTRLMGEVYLALGDSLRAASLAEGVLAARPRDADALFLRGRVHLAQGEWGPATKDLRAYVRSRPEDPRGYGVLARCLDAQGRLDAARDQRRIAELVERRLDAEKGAL